MKLDGLALRLPERLGAGRALEVVSGRDHLHPVAATTIGDATTRTPTR